MKIILKFTIVASTNDQKNSYVKHLPLGSKLVVNKNEHIDSISFDDVKFVYSGNDVDKEELE